MPSIKESCYPLDVLLAILGLFSEEKGVCMNDTFQIKAKALSLLDCASA